MVSFTYASPALHDLVGSSTGAEVGGLIGADTGQADVGGLIGADIVQADVGGLIGADTGQADVVGLIGAIFGPPEKPMVTLVYAGTTEVLMELTLIIRETPVPEKLFMLYSE